MENQYKTNAFSLIPMQNHYKTNVFLLNPMFFILKHNLCNDLDDLSGGELPMADVCRFSESTSARYVVLFNVISQHLVQHIIQANDGLRESVPTNESLAHNVATAVTHIEAL